MDNFPYSKKIITDHNQLLQLIQTYRNNKYTIVTTNGCFDILHKGHILYLYESKKMGDKLIICLNSDESVKKIKGDGRPINTFTDRATVLSALEFVDIITIFNETTPIKILDIIKPDIHTKGGDYKIIDMPETDVVEKNNGKIKLIPFVNGYSTTRILEI